MMTDFSGKHVIVTGGTGALGIALVNMMLAFYTVRKRGRLRQA